jgi:hypothetical protein
VLTTLGNWDTDHYAFINDLPGCSAGWTWESSTSSTLLIQRSINHGVQKIQIDTRGVVKPKQLQLVMSPVTAAKIAVSQEIKDFVKQQVTAPQMITGEKWGMDFYGLPDKLYGIPIQVEDTVRVTSVRDAAVTTADWAMPEGAVFLMARPGSIMSSAGAGPSFSTVTLFFKEEFTAEKKLDVDNRRTEARVVDHYDPVMTAPVAGFYFRAVTDDALSSSS